MRKVLLPLIVVSGLFLFGCYYEDDYVFVDLQIQDALIFENEKSYVVGDTIFFSLRFSRYLEEEGFSNKLDVFETTGAQSFNYPLNLEKFSPQSNSYVFIEVANDLLVAQEGRIGNQNNTLEATLNEANDSYESSAGLILAETGNFRIFFDFFTLHPNTEGDRINLLINHSLSNTSLSDFEFEVTE